MFKKCNKCWLPVIILITATIIILVGALVYTYFIFNNSIKQQNQIKQKNKQTENLITKKETTKQKTIPTKPAKNIVTIELEQGKVITKPVWYYDATSTIKVDGKVATKITSQNGQPVKLFRETNKNAYFLAQPSGVGGYILYEIRGLLYKLDLTNFKLKTLSGFYAFHDVSHNEELLAWRDKTGISLTDDLGKIKYQFSVDKKYTQFGATRFSPDDTKIAYSASIGYPDENERTAIFVVDIKSGKQSKLIETTSHKEWIKFVKWIDNKTVRIKKTDYGQSDVDSVEKVIDLIVK